MKKEKIAAIALAALVAASATALPTSAAVYNRAEADFVSTYFDREESERSFSRKYLSLKGIPSKNVWSYNRLSVKIGGLGLSVKGLEINGKAYIPFRAAASAIGASYSYNSSDRSSVMKASGLSINAGDGCYTVYANDRALFSDSPVVIMNDGRMYIPAEIFAKAVGMTLSVNGNEVSISGKYSPLLHASKFYREDEVFWLARIIHAESRGEPLFGKIAVGDVVLNRVKSSAYPNTIYGVIFDRKYGVQFSPILDGSIYNTPDFNSILAAKICLDGYMISPDVLFFLEPSHSTSSWIPKNRQYLFTIGSHDFYK
ncbi:MAG: cell wall hydrolase [Clostridia bacterium]|nr:cell wall hydrolase [Clostridia bacterium]